MTPRMPLTTAKEMVRFLKAKGFLEERQTGSHLILFHPERHVSITIPIHGSVDLGRGLAVRILKDAGFSVDDYINS